MDHLEPCNIGIRGVSGLRSRSWRSSEDSMTLSIFRVSRYRSRQPQGAGSDPSKFFGLHIGHLWPTHPPHGVQAVFSENGVMPYLSDLTPFLGSLTVGNCLFRSAPPLSSLSWRNFFLFRIWVSLDLSFLADSAVETFSCFDP